MDSGVRILFKNLQREATISVFEYQNPMCNISGITSIGSNEIYKFSNFFITLEQTYLKVMKISVALFGRFILLPSFYL